MLIISMHVFHLSVDPQQNQQTALTLAIHHTHTERVEMLAAADAHPVPEVIKS